VTKYTTGMLDAIWLRKLLEEASSQLLEKHDFHLDATKLNSV